MDILKAATRVGSVAGQAVATAVQQRQLEVERKVLRDLRADALALRARIGEEVFKQWKAGRLPSSGLDELLNAVDSTTAAIARQRGIIDQLLAGPASPNEQPGTRVTASEDVAETGAPEWDSPARERSIGPVSPAEPPACATCGAADQAGRPFCGFCGARLG